MLIARSEPSSPLALEGHACQTGPTADLGPLGFLSLGHPAGPRAPWAPWRARLPGALATGSPGPRRLGRPLRPGLWVCGQPGWPPPSGLDAFLGNFGALGLRAGSALASSVGPGGGEADTRVCGPKGCRAGTKGASPLREWAADRGPPNFGGPREARGARLPGRFSEPASRAHPWTFVNQAHLLAELASAPCPCPEPSAPIL